MRAEVTIDEKREVVVTLIPTDEEKLVRGITVFVGGDPRPIMRMPFYIHGDEKVIHSICRRDSDNVEMVEW